MYMNHEVLKEYENLSERLCFLLICVIIKQLLALRIFEAFVRILLIVKLNELWPYYQKHVNQII